MYSKTLDCLFTTIFDPSDDTWTAVQVYRDGNEIELGIFNTEEEAEEYANNCYKEQLNDNSQFGVGA